MSKEELQEFFDGDSKKPRGEKDEYTHFAKTGEFITDFVKRTSATMTMERAKALRKSYWYKCDNGIALTQEEVIEIAIADKYIKENTIYINTPEETERRKQLWNDMRAKLSNKLTLKK